MKKLLISAFIISQSSWAAFLPKTFEADMEQVYSSIRGERKDPIHVTYKFPSKFIFENKGSAKITYVCNQKKVWVYTPPFIEGEPGEVKIAESGKYCFSKLFDTLSHGLKTNNLYKVIIKGKSAQILFLPKTKDELQIREINLSFKENIELNTQFDSLLRMEILKLNEQKPLYLTIKSLKTNTKLEDSLFVFKTPKNTNTKVLE